MIAPVDEKIREYGLKAARFAHRPAEKDRRITILEGAVRSSKTWAMMAKLLFHLNSYQVKGHRVITGVSKQTIYQNVLTDLFDVVGEGNYAYNRMSGDLNILGTKWLTIGAKDEGSEKYLRGMTIGIWYADELVLQPKNFVMMALNRMSPKGARGYATTNPDSPFHFVKTDIIENAALIEASDIETIHFDLEDNPNLSEEYKAFLRRAYVGVYYQRYVLGRWVVAEGAIYGSCWNERELCYDGPCPVGSNVGDEIIGVDCGVGHPQVYLGVVDDGETLWIDREYVWESEVTMQQKTDGQYADDLEDFMKGGNRAGLPGREFKNAIVLLPPECASFEAELTLRGIWHTDADNDVADGIRMTASMMALRKIKFSRERCPKTIAQLPAYAWDQKKAIRGVEEPIKQHDDCADAVRYVVKTRVASWRIAGQAA
jgi:PBSX family phage terminase large subunit